MAELLSQQPCDAVRRRSYPGRAGGLGHLDDDELAGLLCASRRLASWAAAAREPPSPSWPAAALPRGHAPSSTWTTEAAGTGALAGRDLPPAHVIAGDRHIDKLARWLKAHGAQGNLDQLRAKVDIALLTGQRPGILLAPAAASADHSIPPGARPPGSGPPRSDVIAWLSGITLTGLEAGTGRCAHTRETRGCRPSAALRHLIKIRDWLCSFPGCGRQAVRCDDDHTIAYDQGGTGRRGWLAEHARLLSGRIRHSRRLAARAEAHGQSLGAELRAMLDEMMWQGIEAGYRRLATHREELAAYQAEAVEWTSGWSSRGRTARSAGAPIFDFHRQVPVARPPGADLPRDSMIMGFWWGPGPTKSPRSWKT